MHFWRAFESLFNTALGRGARGLTATSERSSSNPRAKREEGGTGGQSHGAPPRRGPAARGCSAAGHVPAALGGGNTRVVWPVECSPLHPTLGCCFSAEPERKGRERSCAPGPASGTRSRLPFPAPHPLTAELRRSQLPYLFIYPSVMSAEDAFEALLVISLAG